MEPAIEPEVEIIHVRMVVPAASMIGSEQEHFEVSACGKNPLGVYYYLVL